MSAEIEAIRERCMDALRNNVRHRAANADVAALLAEVDRLRAVINHHKGRFSMAAEALADVERLRAIEAAAKNLVKNSFEPDGTFLGAVRCSDMFPLSVLFEAKP